MPRYSVDYTIDGYKCNYLAQGELAPPDVRCLLDGDDDLMRGRPWYEEGYTVADAPLPQAELREMALRLIGRLVRQAGAGELARLEDYHRQVSDAQHALVAQALGRIPDEAPDYFPLACIERRVSEVLQVPVRCFHKEVWRYGCSIRIVRPHSRDYNPLHRDAWIDRLRHGVNVYIPVAGSNALSSLSLLPRSHRWRECDTVRTGEGSIANGMAYTVPSIIRSTEPLAMVRPPVGEDEFLLFSPYMIHGGAVNFNDDITRISMEMRFWRA